MTNNIHVPIETSLKISPEKVDKFKKMGHLGKTLPFLTFALCILTAQTLSNPVQRMQKIERLAQASKDFFNNRLKFNLSLGITSENQNPVQQDPDTSLVQTLLNSPAAEQIIITENDLINKGGPMPMVNILPLNDEAQIQSPPILENDETTTKKPMYVSPEERSRLMSMMKLPAQNQSVETSTVNTARSSLGSPALNKSGIPNFEMREMERLSDFTNNLLNGRKAPVIQSSAQEKDQEDMSGQNMLVQKQSPQSVPSSQTTVVIKNSDPPPPTVNVEQLIAKQDELFALILQYHTEVNKLIQDILAKLSDTP